MAISRIGTPATANGTSITIPAGHQIGDLLLIYAFASTSVSPTIPAGWTAVASTNAGATGHAIGYKIATSGAETSGTWTSANCLICVVYRGQRTAGTPVGIGATGYAVGATGTGTTLTYGTITESQKNSWLVAFAGTKTTDSTIATAPTSMSNTVNASQGLNQLAHFDSNAIYATPGGYTTNNVSIGGTSAEWRTFVTAVYPEVLNNQNYMSIKGGDGMSFGERIY